MVGMSATSEERCAVVAASARRLPDLRCGSALLTESKRKAMRPPSRSSIAGAAPALIDLIGGRLTFFFDSVSSALPHLKAGTLRALAVTTARRSTLVPEIPTMAEALNLPDYDLPLFYGIAAPARTPPEVVNVLHAALSKGASDAALREQFASMGFELQSVPSPEDYTRFLRQQFDKFKSLKN